MLLITRRIGKNTHTDISDFIEKIKSILEFITVYIKAISFDKQKLYDALSNKHGYIKNYSEYFQERIDENQETHKIYPAGSNKLYYFHFFLSYEIGNI